MMGYVDARPLAGAISMIGVVIHHIEFLCDEQLMQLFWSEKHYLVIDGITWYIGL